MKSENIPQIFSILLITVNDNSNSNFTVQNYL